MKSVFTKISSVFHDDFVLLFVCFGGFFFIIGMIIFNNYFHFNLLSKLLTLANLHKLSINRKRERLVLQLTAQRRVPVFMP